MMGHSKKTRGEKEQEKEEKKTDRCNRWAMTRRGTSSDLGQWSSREGKRMPIDQRGYAEREELFLSRK